VAAFPVLGLVDVVVHLLAHDRSQLASVGQVVEVGQYCEQAMYERMTLH
jgi:hypothetical protein